MSDYIVCTRNISKGKFGNEPGASTFIKVSKNKKTISPDEKTTRNAWFEEVRKAAVSEVDENGDECGDILVFVHGYNNSQEDVLRRHREIEKSLNKNGFKGIVVSFDWPSNDKAINYLEDRSDAKFTAIKLVDDCIKRFAATQNNRCKINVHILAHSTGAYVIREAFDDADDRPAVAASNWSVSQIMFIGADVSSRSMSAQNSKSSSIYRHCVRLTNYSNPFDSILKLSNVKRVGVAPRVGRIGLPHDIPEHAVNVDCGKFYQANEGSMMEVLGAKSHSWYIGNPAFTKDMLLTIQGDIDRHSIPTRELVNGKLFLL